MKVGDLEVSFLEDGGIAFSLKAGDKADGEWHAIGVVLRTGPPPTAELYLDGEKQDLTL